MVRVHPPQPGRLFGQKKTESISVCPQISFNVKELADPLKKEKILKLIATLGPVGYSPVAPGTAGTAIAAILCYILAPSEMTVALILPLTFIIGVIASSKTEQLLNEKDSSHIVIDEVGGYMVSILFLPSEVKVLLLAFLLFRFFDILKPFPIRSIERQLSGGLGVMVDDIIAGVYANLILRLLLFYKLIQV